MNLEKIEYFIKKILIEIEEDPEREGLKETPKRVAKMYEELMQGIKQNPADHLKTYFNEFQCGDMILVKDINFYSLCEHHMLPFFGKIHIAYIPNNGKILGLSKFGRIIDSFSKRLQVQERLTNQIGDLIMKETDTNGVYVIIEAEHMCMAMRGLKKEGSKTITIKAFGEFIDNETLKSRVISLIKNDL